MILSALTNANPATKVLVTIASNTELHPKYFTKIPSIGPSKIPPVLASPLTKLVTPAPAFNPSMGEKQKKLIEI